MHLFYASFICPIIDRFQESVTAFCAHKVYPWMLIYLCIISKFRGIFLPDPQDGSLYGFFGGNVKESLRVHYFSSF